MKKKVTIREQKTTIQFSLRIMLPPILGKQDRTVFFLLYLATYSPFHHHHPHVRIHTQLSVRISP